MDKIINKIDKIIMNSKIKNKKSKKNTQFYALNTVWIKKINI